MVYSYQNVRVCPAPMTCLHNYGGHLRSSGSEEIISAVHADRIEIADVAILNSDRMGKNRSDIQYLCVSFHSYVI